MRELLLKLHRWSGLILGLIILVVSVTGSALVFESDIDAWLNPELSLMTPELDTPRVAMQKVVDNVRKEYPKDPPTSIRIVPTGVFVSNRTIEVALKSGQTAYVNPYSGAVLGARSREKSFARFLHLLHTRLVAGETGEYIVGGITLVTFGMALSGLYLW